MQLFLTFSHIAAGPDAAASVGVPGLLALPGQAAGQLRVPANNASFPVPPWATGVDLASSIDFVLSTAPYNGKQTGITFSATATLSSASKSSIVRQAFDTLRAGSATNINLNFNVFVPLFSTNPTYLTLSLSESGTFSLSNNLQCSRYQLDLAVSAQSTITLSTQLLVSLKQTTQPLAVDLSANWQAGSSTTFTGALKNTWNNAFGLSWLSISSATVTLVVGPAVAINKLSLDGSASVKFANSSSPARISTKLSTTGDFLLSVSNLPIGNTLAALFSAVAGGSQPEILSGVAVQGTAAFSVATYNAGSVKKGFTLNAEVTLTSTSNLVYKAAQVLQASPSGTSFSLALFIPIFGPQPIQDIQLDFTQSGHIALTKSVSIDSYTIDVSVSQSVSVTLSASIAVTASQQGQSAVFTVSATWSEGQSDVQFSGTLQSGSWEHPFGLSWLTITSASLTFVVGTSRNVDKFDISAAASVTFSQSSVSADVDINNNGDARLSVNNIPINNLVLPYIDITGQSPPTFMAGVMLDQATVSFTVSTYSDGRFQKGFTLEAKATLLGGQQLTKAAQVIVPSASSLKFDLALFIPIFSANPEYFSLVVGETGDFPLTQNIHCESVKLSFDNSNRNAKIAITTDLSIILAQQNNQPVVFEISGQWNENTDVSFSGALQGAWSAPFGLAWLQITSASISVDIGEATLRSLSIAAAATITLDKQPQQVSVSLTLAENFKDFTLAAEVHASWKLPGIVEGLLHKDFPVLSNLVHNSKVSLSVTLSSYNHGSVKSGLTIGAQGTYRDIKSYYCLLTECVATVVGGLLGQISGISRKNLGSLNFNLALNIPIFSTDPADVSITLEVDDEIAITPHFFYEGVKFELEVAPLSVALDTEFLATFTANPPLKFDIGGKIAQDGTALFTGEMIGTNSSLLLPSLTKDLLQRYLDKCLRIQGL